MGKLETKTKERARRVQIRQKVMLALFRMTTGSASAAFAPEAVLRKRHNLMTSPPKHLRLEPVFAQQKSFGNGQNTLRGAPLRARQFFKNRPCPATGSAARARTWNQLLTRNPTLL